MPNYNSKTPLEETFDKSNIFSKVDNSNTELSFTQPERTISAEVVPTTSTTSKEKKKTHRNKKHFQYNYLFLQRERTLFRFVNFIKVLIRAKQKTYPC